MLASIALRVGRTVPLVALVLGLLTACAAGPFKMQLDVPNPATVGSVYVLFGNESELTVKQREGAEVEALILPSRLKSYVAYAEYELSASSSALEWRVLGQSLREQIELTNSEKTPGALQVKLNRRLLDLYPELAVAIVARTADNEYLAQTWPSTVVAEAKGTLLVKVTADGVTDSAK
jgi:hypothetical protein